MTKYDEAYYAAEITRIHSELKDYPDNKTLHNQLISRLGKWQSLLNVIIFTASNEQLPWLESEIGMITQPMPRKSENGYQQVGDYQVMISKYDYMLPILTERKGGKHGEDLYSSLMSSRPRDRFYREIDRFQADDRFSQMIVITECSYLSFLNYIPLFNGKNRNKNHIAASKASRVATIAALYAKKNITIQWCGDRPNAIGFFKQLIRQSTIANYKEILGL